MSKNYIVFDSMMVPPQKNIFLLLYCIIFDNKFLLILRNSKLLSINFLCVTLSHMSIRAGIVIAITFQQVDHTPDAKASADGDHEGLENGNCRIEKSHRIPPYIIKGRHIRPPEAELYPSIPPEVLHRPAGYRLWTPRMPRTPLPA